MPGICTGQHGPRSIWICVNRLYLCKRRDIRIWNRQPPPEDPDEFHHDLEAYRQLLIMPDATLLAPPGECQSGIPLQHHHQCLKQCRQNPMRHQRCHYQRSCHYHATLRVTDVCQNGSFKNVNDFCFCVTVSIYYLFVSFVGKERACNVLSIN